MGFPGGPVVKTQGFHGRGSGVNPDGELRSRMPHGSAKMQTKYNKVLQKKSLFIHHMDRKYYINDN